MQGNCIELSKFSANMRIEGNEAADKVTTGVLGMVKSLCFIQNNILLLGGSESVSGKRNERPTLVVSYITSNLMLKNDKVPIIAIGMQS